MKLELQNLTGGYGKRIVVDDVSFSVPEHSIVTLLGPNGCGKSTLLRLAGRLLKPFSGTVLADGRSVHSIPTGRLAKELAILPQFHEIPSGITVEELVRLGRYPHGTGPEENRKVVEDAMTLTGIAPLRKNQVSMLSGGERQKVWIAMTLAQSPEMLLLDEPTTFLDIRCQFEILSLIRKLNRERKITVLMVLHDLNSAAVCSDRMIFMKDHRIFKEGTPEEMMKPEIIRAVFGVETRILDLGTGVPHCILLGPAE